MSSPLPDMPWSLTMEEAHAMSTVGNWSVHQYARTASTNLLASKLPPWHAVRADVQTAGRGRFQRRWVSDEGGLWLSAVVPMAAHSGPGPLLPLAVGLAVCEGLRNLGVQPLRMRWPNDVMVQHAKLAGLLIDQFIPGSAVVGIGLNVNNRPEERDPTLKGQAIRLADLVTPTPSLDEITRVVLAQLESVCTDWMRLGTEAFLPRINRLWITPALVQLTLDSGVVTGQFEGVDAAGRLCLRTHTGPTEIYEPHQVRLLREI